MTNRLVCWKCGTEIPAADLPVSRRSECRKCYADLHVCVMCRFFSPKLDTKCSHLTADSVREKERSNFCDHFRPRPNAHMPMVDVKAEKAKSELAALFGSGNEESTPAVKTDADRAREELEKLFGTQDKNNNEQ